MHWSVLDLAGTTLLKKTTSPSFSSHQLSKAPQLGVKAGNPPFIHTYTHTYTHIHKHTHMHMEMHTQHAHGHACAHAMHIHTYMHTSMLEYWLACFYAGLVQAIAAAMSCHDQKTLSCLYLPWSLSFGVFVSLFHNVPLSSSTKKKL